MVAGAALFGWPTLLCGTLSVSVTVSVTVTRGRGRSKRRSRNWSGAGAGNFKNRRFRQPCSKSTDLLLLSSIILCTLFYSTVWAFSGVEPSPFGGSSSGFSHFYGSSSSYCSSYGGVFKNLNTYITFFGEHCKINTKVPCSSKVDTFVGLSNNRICHAVLFHLVSPHSGELAGVLGWYTQQPISYFNTDDRRIHKI